jgi:hypothetical protein
LIDAPVKHGGLAQGMGYFEENVERLLENNHQFRTSFEFIFSA